jgi:hypothetical protein
MIGLFCFALAVLTSAFKSKWRLEAENAVLRHQLIVLRRRLHGRVRLTNHERWFFIQLYRWFPSILKVLTIIQPETLVRWHRAGFRCYWRWKSRPQGGRPQIDSELRVLIRRMSVENPLWGAPRPARSGKLGWVNPRADSPVHRDSQVVHLQRRQRRGHRPAATAPTCWSLAPTVNQTSNPMLRRMTRPALSAMVAAVLSC